MVADLNILRVCVYDHRGERYFAIGDVVRHGHDGRVGYIESLGYDKRTLQRWAWVRHKADGTNHLVGVKVNLMAHENNDAEYRAKDDEKQGRHHDDHDGAQECPDQGADDRHEFHADIHAGLV